jgi:hypothetical protein
MDKKGFLRKTKYLFYMRMIFPLRLCASAGDRKNLCDLCALCGYERNI